VFAGGRTPPSTERRTTLNTLIRGPSPLSRRRLLGRAGGIAVGAAALSVAGLGATGAQGHTIGASLEATPAEGLRAAMRRLWEDHIVWTRMFIVASVAGTPDAGPAAERLLRNQTDIGDAVKPFYGEAAGAKLTALLRDHILGAADLLAAVKSGDAAKAGPAQTAWYANGDEIAAFLSAANPTAWPLAALQGMMRGHLDQTLEEAGARLKGDWAADIAAYDKIHEHILGMADALADGIVKQFPERFAGGDAVVVPDLRGLDEAEATRRIVAAGLAATTNNHQGADDVAPAARDYFLSKQPGQVVSQMPAPGQRVAPGTAVHLAVRKQ
jgi:hypothetical protein